MENVYIDTIEIGNDLELNYENITTIFSDHHEDDCCESHWADWSYIKDFIPTAKSIIPVFNKMEIQGTPEMGFTLFFINGEKRFGIFVPCYSSNNGYYSDNLTLIAKLPNGFKKEYDISSYQPQSGY